MESLEIPMRVDAVIQIEGASRGCEVPRQGASNPSVASMPCRHGALFGTISEAVIVESSHEWGMLFDATDEASIEEGEVPREVSALSGTVD